MSMNITSTQKRVFQYWFSDGLAELALGLVCLLMGLYLLAQSLIPQGSFAYRLLNLFSVVIVFGITRAVRRLLNSLKNRLTYPRTGFVAYKRPGKLAYLATGLVGLFIFILVTGLLAFPDSNLAWMPAAAGIVFGGVLLFQALRTGLHRLFVLALISLLVGGGLAFSGIPDPLGLAFFFLLTGPCTLVPGAINLYRYLRLAQAGIEGRV